MIKTLAFGGLCFGLGYAKALSDSSEIIERLDGLKMTLDDLVRTFKYGDVIEGKVIEDTKPDAEGEKAA